uniref:Putative ovule protein n=1 Tax=Solanum chacoense TaxID=4108 RepID=A0A0V0GHJ9_SOLCH
MRTWQAATPSPLQKAIYGSDNWIHNKIHSHCFFPQHNARTPRLVSWHCRDHFIFSPRNQQAVVIG